MKRRFSPEHFGILSPFLAVFLGVLFVARRELDVIESPLVIAGVCFLLIAASSMIYGLIGAAVASLVFTGLAFLVHPAHPEGIHTAFALVPLAAWLSVITVFAKRALSGWQRRKLVGVGDELEQLRLRITQLESLNAAGSVAEVLGAASASWRKELADVVRHGSAILARIPQQARGSYEDKAFETSLRRVEEKLAAQDMLAGNMSFDVQQEAKLEDVVKRGVERVADTYERLGLSIETDIEQSGVPCAMDVSAMTEALVALLDNAAEASATGSKVIVRATSDFRGDRGVIEVIDKGSGVASDVLPYVFKPFFTTRPERMGLGLSIAREIVARHSGSIAVASNESRGVTFRIRLPMKRAELQSGTAERARARKEEEPRTPPPQPAPSAEQQVLEHIKRLKAENDARAS